MNRTDLAGSPVPSDGATGGYLIQQADGSCLIFGSTVALEAHLLSEQQILEFLKRWEEVRR